MDELLARYRALHALYVRAWRSDEVRNAVLSLSLIIRQYAFGHSEIAVNAALLLEQSEPLEHLESSDLAVKKMQALTLATRRQYDEALCILDPLRLLHADDAFIQRLYGVCMQNRRPARRRH